MPIDPNWLVGGGEGGQEQRPMQGGPPPLPSPQGRRPVLTAISMTGLDRPGAESLTFTFADGFKAVETFPELIKMGVDQKVIGAVSQVFEHAGDVVYDTNRGGGGMQR